VPLDFDDDSEEVFECPWKLLNVFASVHSNYDNISYDNLTIMNTLGHALTAQKSIGAEQCDLFQDLTLQDFYDNKELVE